MLETVLHRLSTIVRSHTQGRVPAVRKVRLRSICDKQQLAFNLSSSEPLYLTAYITALFPFSDSARQHSMPRLHKDHRTRVLLFLHQTGTDSPSDTCRPPPGRRRNCNLKGIRYRPNLLHSRLTANWDGLLTFSRLPPVSAFLQPTSRVRRFLISLAIALGKESSLCRKQRVLVRGPAVRWKLLTWPIDRKGIVREGLFGDA